jgi:RES domain-containing protein
VPTSEDPVELLAALERREASLRLFRAARTGYDPLSSRGARLHGGRWNRPGTAALYTSFEPLTVRAELLRLAERQGEPEEALYPVTLAELAVDAELVDLEPPGLLSSLGIGEPLSALTPLGASRAIGKGAAALGIGALRVPSVATRAANVVLFPENLQTQPSIEALSILSTPDDWPEAAGR